MDERNSTIAGSEQLESAAAPGAVTFHPQLLTSSADDALPMRYTLPEPPPVARRQFTHPLDRRDFENDDGSEASRIRLAWVKLTWLLAFLGVLLAVSYLVPFIAEQTQYAITRGQQRAEHDFAKEHIGESPLDDLSRAYQKVSQIVGPSVVHISTLGMEASPIRTLSTRPRSRIPTEGQGSGIIIESSGFILTNYHVIRDSTQIDVSLADGRKVRARKIGHDAATDLAVLQIKADKLVPATWGDSEQTQTGALVWAVGSPFGLERSITSGILSAKHRAGRAGTLHQDFLQTDAAVNPGNSGGPLVDNSGRVIGVNTAIVGDAFQGISFAIPSQVAREVYNRVKTEGTLKRGWLGVALGEVTDEFAQEAGMASPSGVYIISFAKPGVSSPAASAGIQPGDVVLKWNGNAVNMPAELMEYVRSAAIGSKAKATILREGKQLILDIVVGERPDDA